MKAYLPIPRDKPGKPPWGYMIPPDGGIMFIPIVDDLKVLEEGFKYLDEGASFDKVAAFISSKTSKSISNATVINRYRADPEHEEGRAKRAKLVSNYTENNVITKRKHRTPEQKAALGIGRAKAKLTRAEKKLSALKESKAQAELEIAKSVQVSDEATPIQEEVRETVYAEPLPPAPSLNIIKPNAGPQTDFLASSEFETFYGGSAGPGKSWALVVDPLRTVHLPSHKAITFRKTNDELRELISMSKDIYPKVVPGAKFQEQKSTWVFPNGGWHWYRYLDRDDDVKSMQGQSFSWAGFDELTHWPTPFVYEYIRSRVRSTDPDIKPYVCIRSTSNPGSAGHCVREGEVLTTAGWKDIRNIKIGELVATADPITGKFCYKEVEQVHSSEYDDDLISVNARNLKIECTKEHKIARLKNSNGFYELSTYADLPGQAYIIRSCLDYTGVNYDSIVIEQDKTVRKLRNNIYDIPADLYFELAGWFISEGCLVHCHKAVSLSQKKEHQRAKIEKLLHTIGLKYTASGVNYTIYYVNLFNNFKQFGHLCHNKCIPRWMLEADKPLLRILFTSLMAGDGHWVKEDISGKYYTTSEALSKQVEELALKLGYSVRTTTRKREGKLRAYETSVSVLKNGANEVLTGNHIYNVSTFTKRGTSTSLIPYKGTVYCIGVKDTHSFFIKQKGSIWLSGNSWVKRTFVDPAPPNTRFPAIDLETGKVMVWDRDRPDLGKKAGDPLFYRRFIPGKLSDNPYLYNDGAYEANLLSLNDVKKRQLLDGDWDIAEGAAFTEFRRDIHTCEPFTIPSNWRKFRASDWGYDKPHCVLWFAQAPEGKLYVYRELYGRKVTPPDLADKVLSAEVGENILYGMLDSSAFHVRDGSASIAQGMIARGCQWRPADRSPGSRVVGKTEIHRRLQVRETFSDITGQLTQEPGLVIFNTCVNLIRTLPSIPLDKSNTEDVDSDSEDHAYDALRYGLVSKPMARNERYVVNAIDMTPKRQYDRFGFPK